MSDSDPVLVLKRQLAGEIRSLVMPVHQVVAAYTFGVDQPLISRLVHGQVDRVSLDRLIRMLHHVGRPVTLTVASGPPLRFRFTPPGYLGRLAPRPPGSPATGPVVPEGRSWETPPVRPPRSELARKRFAKWLESW